MKAAKPLIYFTVFVAWLGHFLVDMMIGIWPVYKTLAHIDIAFAGIISGLGAFLGEGLQLFFGALSDKGYRKQLVLGGVVATTASVCFVYTDSYYCLFALYLLTCLGSGAFHPCAASLVADIPTQKKGMLMGLFTSGGALGLATSQIIFTYMYFWFDGHVVWLALPAILLMVFAGFSRLGVSCEKPATSTKHFDVKTILQFFRQRELRMLYFTQVCNATMMWGTIFLLPDVLSSRGYESWIAFGGGHMAFILGGAVMMMPTGYLADRYSARSVIIVATIVGMVLFYLFLLFPLLNNYTLLALLFCMGAAIATVNPIGISMGTRLMPSRKGMVSAMLMGLVWCVSEVIGQTGGGLLTKCFSDDAAAKALAVLGGMFLIGTITASQLPAKETVLEPVEYA